MKRKNSAIPVHVLHKQIVQVSHVLAHMELVETTANVQVVQLPQFKLIMVYVKHIYKSYTEIKIRLLINLSKIKKKDINVNLSLLILI